jgi:hypothetical protein
MTTTGLTVRCELDPNMDRKKRGTWIERKGDRRLQQGMESLNITRNAFHGEWNHTIHPSAKPVRAVNSG